MGNGALETSRPLTYVIYWKPTVAIANGHAAMIIDSSAFAADDQIAILVRLMNDTSNYVSWMGGGGLSPFSQRGVASDFSSDSMDWKGHELNNGRNLPTRWVALKGLNIAAMRAEWDGVRNKQGGANWKVIDKNCATVVARVLKAGGAKSKSWRASHQLVWWPTDVIRYAKSLTGYVHRTS